MIFHCGTLHVKPSWTGGKQYDLLIKCMEIRTSDFWHIWFIYQISDTSNICQFILIAKIPTLLSLKGFNLEFFWTKSKRLERAFVQSSKILSVNYFIARMYYFKCLRFERLLALTIIRSNWKPLLLFTSIAHWIKYPLWRTIKHNHHACNFLNLYFFSTSNLFLIKKKCIYSDRIWCDFFEAIIWIYKITELWK